VVHVLVTVIAVVVITEVDIIVAAVIITIATIAAVQDTISVGAWDSRSTHTPLAIMHLATPMYIPIGIRIIPMPIQTIALRFRTIHILMIKLQSTSSLSSLIIGITAAIQRGIIPMSPVVRVDGPR